MNDFAEASPRPAPAPPHAVRLLRALLFAPALLALAVAVYMALDFPPFQVLDEAAHLHAVSRIASGALPRVGEPFDAAVIGLGLPVPPPGGPVPRRRFERYYLLHPPAYHLLAAPVYALAGGDAEAGLRAVRAAGGAAVVLLALAVPLLLLRAPPWRSSEPARRIAGAAIAVFPLALPGVLFVATFVTNHALDLVCATLLGVCAGAALAEQGAARGRWTAAAAVVAGLLAAGRLNNAWAPFVPFAIAAAAPAARRRRDLATACAGLVPGGLLLGYWMAWNAATSHRLLPRAVVEFLVEPLTAAPSSAAPRLQPVAAMTELVVGQGKPGTPLDVTLALVLWLGIAAWWLAATRSRGSSPRAGLVAPALAVGAVCANLALLLASVSLVNGRYLLASTCFAWSLAGASFAAGPAASTGRIADSRHVRRVALAALAASVAALAAWLPPARLTPPFWGAIARWSPRTPLVGVFGWPEPPPRAAAPAAVAPTPGR